MVSSLALRASWINERNTPDAGPEFFDAGYMPDIEMKPPRGSSLNPYSVSPMRRDHSRGPKPIMYWPTRTPKSFAGTRWPTSCRPIESPRPISMKRMPAR